MINKKDHGKLFGFFFKVNTVLFENRSFVINNTVRKTLNEVFRYNENSM